ncbi:hypothetical protein FOZ62_003267 [Perkinsus olseni]|uniref:Uncharacterized protein n=2 Tax=Perkinsus olseni TaxID=32597 RepID=A0A7J6UBS8_PEROL|nr:hypothetical protein FOZ62_003267 [Perkinsus olseni]
MGASMTEGMSMLDRERREALTGAQFDTQTSELENKQRLDRLNTVTSGAKRISIMENQELLALEHAQKNNITKVQEELRDIKQGMKTRMSNVMSELAKAQSQVDRSGKEDQADVAFRLGLVRQACAQFIAIWREYAGSMQKKLGRFHQVDMETLELLDQASEKAQADTRAKVERAVDKVRNYDRQLNQGYKEAEEFSEYADEEVAKLEEKDRETEAEREEVMEESVRDLEELEKSQDKLNKEQLLGIKGALRK